MQAANQSLVLSILDLLDRDPALRLNVRDAASRLMQDGAAKTAILALVGQGYHRSVNGPAKGDIASVITDVGNDTPE